MSVFRLSRELPFGANSLFSVTRASTRTAAALISILGLLLAMAYTQVGGQGNGEDQPPRPIQPTVAPSGPLTLIPAESMFVWKGLPLPDTTAESGAAGPGQRSAIDVLFDVLPQLMPETLDTRGRVTLAVLKSFGEVFRRPFALGIIDARAKIGESGGQSRKIDKLRTALVVENPAADTTFVKVIQRIVNEFTDQGQARLEKSTFGAWTYYELHDQRLPEWSHVAWGQIEGFFVLTVGEGVWPLVAKVAEGKAPSIATDEWFAPVRATQKTEPLIEVIVAARRIREVLDPLVNGRATQFFDAWTLGEMEKTHWALGFEGRALYCTNYFLDDGKTKRRLYADASIKDPHYLQTVPAEARYAIYRVPVTKFLPRLIASFYSTRRPDEQKLASERWARIQSELGVNVERDALELLGETIVLHNDPPHPLRLPLAFTSLIEIRAEPERVKATLEKLCSAWQTALEETADETGEPPAATLQRDADGVWSLQFGLFGGLAWTFTDRFIVTSWAPSALRSYVDKMGEQLGKRSME